MKRIYYVQIYNGSYWVTYSDYDKYSDSTLACLRADEYSAEGYDVRVFNVVTGQVYRPVKYKKEEVTL